MFVIHDMYDVCNNRDAVCFVSFCFKFFFRDIISHPAGAVRVGFHSSCFLRSGE